MGPQKILHEMMDKRRVSDPPNFYVCVYVSFHMQFHPAIKGSVVHPLKFSELFSSKAFLQGFWECLS